MSPDEQEAKSRRYSNDVVLLLRLASGRVAIFNNARELDRIIEPPPFDLSVKPVTPPKSLPSSPLFSTDDLDL
jgi:hypothetical protein